MLFSNNMFNLFSTLHFIGKNQIIFHIFYKNLYQKQNYEESYESDIQKKFERELQNMERTRQLQNQQNDEGGEEDQDGDNNNDYQGEGDNHYDDGQNYQNGEEDYQHQDEEGNDDQQQEHNQNYYESNQEGYENNDNQEQNDDQYPNEGQNQQNDEEEYQGQENGDHQEEQNEEDQYQENGDNGEKEEVSKKVESHKNEDGSVTTVTYTTVTKTKRIDLQDYSMPTIQESENDKQDTSKHSKITKTTKIVSESTPNALAKNNNDLISQVSQQKMVIQSLKEELKDEREINTIQALEIESLKQLVRRLQGNIDSLNKQVNGGQINLGQSFASPYRTESSRKSEPIVNQVKIYQQMEVEKNKSQVSESKSQIRKNSESDETSLQVRSGKENNAENLYLSSFQKSLWIPEKEKYADLQLYGPPMSEQELKQKTLRPLRKIAPREKQNQSKQNKDQNNLSDVESQTKKKTDKNAFEEELNKIAKQNKDQFAVVYKQNKLKMHQEMFEDYQKRKQDLIEKRENRVREDLSWQESLHPISRAKSVKNISVNIFSSNDNLPRHNLKTPSYIERQILTIKKEIQSNSKSISNIPTLENGYSPNSISSIAAGTTNQKSLEVKSSVQIPNYSLSPEQMPLKGSKTQKKLFLYQVTDADKNYVPKAQQYRQIKMTQEELIKYEQNIENMKEKHREEERKKLEQFDKLKVSPGYRLIRKSSEELRTSQVQSASSQKRNSQQQQQHPNPQFRVPYPTLSGLQQSNAYSYTSNKFDKNQLLNDMSLASSNVMSKSNINPYSIEANPQKGQNKDQPPTPKTQTKKQIITNTNVSSSVSFPAGKNPYVIQNTQRYREDDDNDDDNGNQKKGQQKSSSQDNIKRNNVQVQQYTYTTTSTTNKNSTNQQNQLYQANKDGNDALSNSKGNQGDQLGKRKNSESSNKDTQGQSNQNQGKALGQDKQDQNQQKQQRELTGYKLQQHEYNELFQKGKINIDKNPKHINWEDQPDPKRKPSTNAQNQNQQSGNINKQDGKGQQKLGGAGSSGNQQQNQQQSGQRQPNTYFQQKYSQEFNPQGQVKQQPPNQQQKQQQLQGQKQNNQQNQQQGGKGQGQKSQSQLNNDIENNQRQLTQSSSNKSQGSKSQLNSDINRGNGSGRSKSPRDTYQGGNEGIKLPYTDQNEENDINNQYNNNEGKDRQYGHDPNSIKGVGDIQGVQGKFSQYTSQSSDVVEKQKPVTNKRVPKVREEAPPPKKSQFVENLEKEAEQDHKLEIKDEKVFLKAIESDDEPMFGYDSSEKEEEEEEEEQVEVKLNKRSSLKQSNTTNTLQKRVSIVRDEQVNNYDEDDEEGEDSKYRKTPRTPFRERIQKDEDQLEQSSQDYEDNEQDS